MTGITEIVWQATAYKKIFLNGYHHLILGRTIILPANHATTGLQRGLLKEICFRNGKRPRTRVLLYGSMANVR